MKSFSAQPGHMEQITLNMPDGNHHTEAWDFHQQDGKTEHYALFDLQRVQ